MALLVVTVLAALALVFAHEMRADALGSQSRASKVQSRWVAQGALQAVRADLALAITNAEPPRLATIGVQAQPLGEGLYWLIIPGYEDDQEHTFGLVSEASRLNVNQASAQELIELPGMTEDIAAAIVDWRDQDTEVTPGGAESDYYLSLSTPYNAKDSAYETLGELLLVRGVDAELLYGEDTNRSGVLEFSEDDGPGLEPDDDADGTLDRGLADFVTVYSTEPNTDSEGEARANLNQPSPELGQVLQDELGEDRAGEILGQIQQQRPYQNTLDFYVRAKLTEEEFDDLHDKLTTQGQETLNGRIDAYHAPAEVFDALTALEPGDGDLIVGARPTLIPGEIPGSLAWLVEVLGEEKAVLVASRLTHRSFQFTADIVAISGDGRSFTRLRVVLDTAAVVDGSATLPTVLHVQDLTELGWPLDPAIREGLQAGMRVEEIAATYGSSSSP